MIQASAIAWGEKHRPAGIVFVMDIISPKPVGHDVSAGRLNRGNSPTLASARRANSQSAVRAATETFERPIAQRPHVAVHVAKPVERYQRGPTARLALDAKGIAD